MAVQGEEDGELPEAELRDTTADGLPRLATGVEGFDRLLDGGLPDRRVTLLYGGPGAGKTVLGLQVVSRSARDGLPGIVVCFEETPDELLENHRGFSWGLEELAGDRLHLMSADIGDDLIAAGSFDISGLLASVAAKVRQTGARWVMFDGLDALLGGLQGQTSMMRELYRLKRWLGETGVATLITAKAEEEAGSGLVTFGFMQFVADCVVALRNDIREHVFVRTLRIIKARGTRGGGDQVPFVINEDGLAVASRESRRLEHQISTEHLESGVPRLDSVLGGGYVRGSSILISGAPGTAKTTLAACLAHAASARNERVLFVSFDEAGSQIVENMHSIGLELEPTMEAGLLHVVGYRAGAVSAEEHYIEIRRLIRELEPQHLIIDPISALIKSGGREIASDVTERLLDVAKSRGVTTLMTSLLEDRDVPVEDTESHVSTIADTWINLTYNIRAGERNRALTVIKSRGMAHSNQVRELILGDQGLTLADVYIAGGEVLMGTARMQEERRAEEEASRQEETFERDRQRLGADIEETEERIWTLHRELKHQRRALEQLESQETARGRRREAHRDRMLDSRGAERDDRRRGGER